MNVNEPNVLADLIAAHLPISVEEKEEILAESNVRERLRRLTAIMAREAIYKGREHKWSDVS